MEKEKIAKPSLMLSLLSLVSIVFFSPANGWSNPKFFSPKPSAPQGKSSLKISVCQGKPFRRSWGTNKQTIHDNNQKQIKTISY